MHGVFNAALSGSGWKTLFLALSAIMAKSLKTKAMKTMKATKAKAKGKPKVLAGKVAKDAEEEAKNVAEEEAKKVATKPKGKANAAAAKKTIKAKGKAAAADKKNAKAAAKAKQIAKKPASSWNEWAEEEDDGDDADDGEGEEELAEKDYSVPSKQQSKVFADALARAPGTRGSVPVEIHELWNSMQRGPGSAAERHALRNAIVPKTAGYNHICTIDPNGSIMTRIKDVFEVKQKKVQLKGMTESEMLWTNFQGNEQGMQRAIDKGDIKVINDMYYWKREIHEQITGGKYTMRFGGGDQPAAMSQEDFSRMMELLDFAPWAKWSGAEDSVPQATLKNVAKPGSDAIKKAQECLEAIKAVCINMKNFYQQCQSDGILTQPDVGSIPNIMKNAMKKAKELEKEYMEPLADVIYDPDGTHTATVSMLKEMLHAAAKDLAPLQQYYIEAKALVQKYKTGQKKKRGIDADM